MSDGTDNRPWGRMLGILAGCYATLAGMWAGVDPDIILARSIVSVIVVGVMTRFVMEMYSASRKAM